MKIGDFGQRFWEAARFPFTMTKKIPLSRPATSAIAAFLALTAPAVLAQEAPDLPMTSPVPAPPSVSVPIPAPATTAPVQQTAPSPAPKPVIQVPLDLPPVPSEPAPRAEAPAASAPERSARAPAAGRSEKAAAPAPSAVAAPAEVAPVAPVAETRTEPVAMPAASLPEPAADAAPAASQEKAAAGDDFPWELIGGAAALLLAGGAGLAFARRRRTADESAAGMSYDEMAAAEALPYNPPVERTHLAPAATHAVRPAAPVFAGQDSMGRHQALAFAGPTPDNPFATLSKRLKRARFLDQKERQAYAETLADQKDLRRKPASAWDVSERAEPAPAEQEVRRPEKGPGRKGVLRPGWNQP